MFNQKYLSRFLLVNLGFYIKKKTGKASGKNNNKDLLIQP
jgi:hypothetical protein